MAYTIHKLPDDGVQVRQPPMPSAHDHGNCELCDFQSTLIADLWGAITFAERALRQIALDDQTSAYAGKIAREALTLIAKSIA